MCERLLNSDIDVGVDFSWNLFKNYLIQLDCRMSCFYTLERSTFFLNCLFLEDSIFHVILLILQLIFQSLAVISNRSHSSVSRVTYTGLIRDRSTIFHR